MTLSDTFHVPLDRIDSLEEEQEAGWVRLHLNFVNNQLTGWTCDLSRVTHQPPKILGV